MKILLFIPVYNCERQLARVLSSLRGPLASRFAQIIVVDNLSSDNTVSTAHSFKKQIPNLKVFRNNVNVSLGGSHKVAFLYAERIDATHIAILHGDDQAVAQELDGFLALAKEHPEYDAILGSRFMKGSKLIGYDKKRIFGNRVLNVIYTVFTGKKCLDLGSGMNLIKLDVLKDHVYLGFANRLTFNFELLLFLIRRKANYVFLPITWREEDQVSNARNFNIAKIAFLNLIKWRFSKGYTSITSADEYVNYKEVL
jgi:dolichol-phosphate mannosyltransferase